MLAACDMFEYHPYESRIDGATGLTQRNLEALANLQIDGDFKFAFISDTHRDYDDTDDAVAMGHGELASITDPFAIIKFLEVNIANIDI